MSTTTKTPPRQATSTFENVITEATPFSEGRKVRLYFVNRKGPHEASFRGPDDVIFHVEKGLDGKYSVMYH